MPLSTHPLGVAEPGFLQRSDVWGGWELAQGWSWDAATLQGFYHGSASQVSLDFVKSGSYELERMGVTFPARAHTKSPFDPDNKRVKGFY